MDEVMLYDCIKMKSSVSGNLASNSGHLFVSFSETWIVKKGPRERVNSVRREQAALPSLLPHSFRPSVVGTRMNNAEL